MSSAEYRKAYYLANREKLNQRSRSRFAERTKWLKDLKSSTPCHDCGNLYPYYVMDFDHVSDDKDENINSLMARGASKERIELEISKCEIVCSNCHRVRTFQRGKYRSVEH